jgi:hypothetical protein
MPSHDIIRAHAKGASMHRIILAAIFAVSAFTMGGTALAQKKGSPTLCTMEGCMANCGKAGGQPRLCPSYCTKRIQERKAAGQC